MKKSRKMSRSKNDVLVKNTILGVGVTNEKELLILEYVISSIKRTLNSFYIVTPNPEIIIAAHKVSSFKNTLNNSEIALCDGVGLMYAGSLLGLPFKERITGVDFMKRLCEKVSGQPITVGFLGGRGGVAEKTAECLKRNYSDLHITYVGEEWKENDPHENIDILFVAFGHPKQEIWMEKHLNKISVRVMIGVGGSFDYISGTVVRAPQLFQSLGLEWLYRLVNQPWRWKRQIALLEFVYLVICEKIKTIIQ